MRTQCEAEKMVGATAATTDTVFADGTTIKAGDVFLGYSASHGGNHVYAGSSEMLMPGEALVHIA